MPSESLIKKWSIADQLAQPSISLSNSDRQRYFFLMGWAGEKAPQGIDNTLGTLVSQSTLPPRQGAGKKCYCIRIPSQAEDDEWALGSAKELGDYFGSLKPRPRNDGEGGGER